MIKFIIFIFILIQFIYSQDKGLSSFEKENYKESFEYYLNVLDSRENDISAKFGAGISAFKNQDIETGMKYLQEVSNSEDEILSSRAHFNLANIFKDENKLEESLYHYKKAIELNSKDRDSKINYELLKKMLSQEDQESQSNPGDEGDKSQEDQESQSNPGDEGDKSQEDQESQSNPGDEGDKSQEDQESQSNPGDEGDKSERRSKSQSNPGDEGDKSQEDQESQSNPGDEGDKNQEDQGIQNSKPSDAKNNRPESEELSDKQIQAEAILNALKNQEKINQKQKLIKFKAKTLEKDW